VPESAPPLNILAVRFSSIGDVLLITPLLRAIRAQYPAARVTVLTKPGFVPLLSHNPNLSRVISLDQRRGLRDLAAELRAGRYTHLLDLHDNLRSRMLRLLVPGNWSSYPKHRLARSILIHTKRDLYRDRRPVPERYFSAATHLGVVPDGAPPDFFLGREAEQAAAAWLEAGRRPGPDQPLIALAPGAAHATKRWPPEYWEMLLQRLINSGSSVVLVGGEEDAALASLLVSGAPGGVLNAAGRFGLQETAALLKHCQALVSGDTGVMHMATAVGTPVLALFGPTVRQFGFFPYSNRARVLELPLGCRPCSSKGGPRCPLGHHRCLRDLPPDLVFEALCQSSL
jgi:lipopolysaccharide heptosyltransferase II